MSSSDRRTFLKLMGSGVLAAALQWHQLNGSGYLLPFRPDDNAAR
jgi:phospholipase C